MKKPFTVHGVYNDTVYSAYLIEIAPDGDTARVMYEYQGTNGIKRSKPRTQVIKYTLSGIPFVTFNGRRLHLDNFLRP